MSKKVSGHSLMDRTRATVGLLNSCRDADKEMEMYAFLSLFHPELTHEKKRAISRHMKGQHDD